jgi:hypothetical protein
MKKQYSIYSIALIFLFILSIFTYYQLWRKNRLLIDAPSYYAYLPAAVIHHDLRLNFIDTDPLFFRDKIWFYNIEGNKKLIKHPMGLSVALSPFFIAGHLAAKITGAAQNGYSLCYQNAMSIGVLVYLLIGLFYLRKLLLNWFDDKIVALTLIVIVIGTNLLWYSTFEGLMAHALSFSLLCVCLCHFYNWLKEGSKINLWSCAGIFGLSILIRPLVVTILIYFVIVLLFTKGSFKNALSFLKPQSKAIMISVFIVFAIGCLQMIYWKYATGKWLYDVYIDEHFIFSSPEIFLFLFSFRKGMFVYTPVLIFSVIGLLFLFRKNRAVFYGTVVLMIITVFLLSSWWAWSYGISWGIRPVIDYYSVLSIPLAGGFTFLLNKGKAVKILCSVVIFLFIALNVFQTWQYKNGAIHYDDMTREAYFKGFFQASPGDEWKGLLSPYDWERRIKGLPQIEYSKSYISESLRKKNVYLRAANLKYVAVNSRANNTAAAFADVFNSSASALTAEIFPDGNIALISADGYYMSVSRRFNNALMGIGEKPGVYEQFEIEFLDDDNNRVAFKSVGTGRYLGFDPSMHNIIFANSMDIGARETFRIFIIEP